MLRAHGKAGEQINGGRQIRPTFRKFTPPTIGRRIGHRRNLKGVIYPIGADDGRGHGANNGGF